MIFTWTQAPEWLMAFWKEIDDKAFGKGFDCFTEDAICRLGVAQWNGRDAVRENLRAFIDTGFSAFHEVVEYWDGGSLKVFRGIAHSRRAGVEDDADAVWPGAEAAGDVSSC